MASTGKSAGLPRVSIRLLQHGSQINHWTLEHCGQDGASGTTSTAAEAEVTMRDPTRRGGPEVLDTKRGIARSDTGPAMRTQCTVPPTIISDLNNY